MKIVFWNTARAGDAFGEKLSDLQSILVQICIRCKPDIILLCEMLSTSEMAIEKTGGVLDDYGIIKLDDSIYIKETTLRYILIYNQKSGKTLKDAVLVETKANRPALYFNLGNTRMLGFHAPSVSKTTTPQSEAIKNALKEIISKNNTDFVDIIFGDFNVDGGNPKFADGFIEKVNECKLGLFKDMNFRSKSHCTGGAKGNPKAKANKTLDWAICNNSYLNKHRINIQVINDSRKRIIKRKYEDDDADWGAEVTSEDEKIMPFAKSDHLPILIEIDEPKESKKRKRDTGGEIKDDIQENKRAKY